MNSRRKFLENSALAALSFPLLSSSGEARYALDFDQKSDEEKYWQQVRYQFPLKQDQTYFNNGTMGPTPGYTLQKVLHHLQHYSIHAAEVDYKNNSGPELLTGYFDYRSIREKAGKLINAAFDEIALTPNATFGMNYVANGMELKKGDEIINTNQEHGGGFAAWQQLAKRKGCIYKQANIPVPSNDPKEIIEAVLGQITQKTKVIAIPHIISGYGTILPVKEICAEAKKRGIFTIIDGAQSVGQIAVDVKEIGCDAYYTSLHKWMLAPAGNGLLYIDKSRMPEIWATIASYNWDNQTDHGFRLMQNGTGNPAVLAGLDAAFDFFNSIGENSWFARIQELGDELRSGLSNMKHVTLLSPSTTGMSAGMVAYSVKGYTGPQVQKYLWTEGRLQPRSVGEDYVRHCVHIYNSKKEINAFFELMNKLA